MDFQEQIEQSFYYDETAKCCLRWKNHKTQPSLVGQECGTITKSGRYSVSIKGHPYMAHRVVWQLMYGVISTTDTVFFKDGDVTNCRIDNLGIAKGEDKNWQNSYIANGDWRKVFYLQDGELYWSDARWSGKGLHRKTADAGEKLHTYPNSAGYLHVVLENFRKNSCPYHRILYEWYYGKIPEGMIVDHINGNIQDNRIANLRCVSNAVNGRNVGIADRNQTGVLGVRYRERENRGGSYIAFWNDECGRLKDKSFSCRKYGEDKAFELAVEYRKKVIEKLNGVYGSQGYHENHGKRDSNKRDAQ